MTNSNIVLVAPNQLEDFKALSRNFFKHLENENILPKTPIRKGLDLFSLAFGYESHSALVTKSKGISDSLSLQSKIHSKLDVISKRLSSVEEKLSEDQVQAILLIYIPLPKKSIVDFIDTLQQCDSVSSTYAFASDLHKLYLSGNHVAARKMVENHKWSSEELTKEGWYVESAAREGRFNDLKLGLDLGMQREQEELNLLLYTAISNNNADCCILILKRGADINADVPGSRKSTLIIEIIERPALSPVIEYAINYGIIKIKSKSTHSSLLELLAVHDLTQMTIEIDRISTNSNRVNAFNLACETGNSYMAAYLLNEYPNIDFDTRNALTCFTESFDLLCSLLSVFESFNKLVDSCVLLDCVLRTFPDSPTAKDMQFIESLLTYLECGKGRLSINVCKPTLEFVDSQKIHLLKHKIHNPSLGHHEISLVSNLVCDLNHISTPLAQ